MKRFKTKSRINPEFASTTCELYLTGPWVTCLNIIRNQRLISFISIRSILQWQGKRQNQKLRGFTGWDRFAGTHHPINEHPKRCKPINRTQLQKQCNVLTVHHPYLVLEHLFHMVIDEQSTTSAKIRQSKSKCFVAIPVSNVNNILQRDFLVVLAQF